MPIAPERSPGRQSNDATPPATLLLLGRLLDVAKTLAEALDLAGRIDQLHLAREERVGGARNIEPDERIRLAVRPLDGLVGLYRGPGQERKFAAASRNTTSRYSGWMFFFMAYFFLAYLGFGLRKHADQRTRLLGDQNLGSVRIVFGADPGRLVRRWVDQLHVRRVERHLLGEPAALRVAPAWLQCR